MQMAEVNPELTYDEIISELQIEEQDVEAFIIEGNLIYYIVGTHKIKACMEPTQ